jgi:HPt (histidine-containing phosphotransfer) domain-containing protein
MLDSREARIAAELAQLRTRYLERLPLELSELAGLAAGLAGCASERPQIEELQHRLHKLAGSGGVFGLLDLSHQARRLEQTARELLTQLEQDGAAARWREFSAGVAALSATL